MLKKLLLLLTLICSLHLSAGEKVVKSNPRHRILISTDIGGTDPDDNQSMIHLLMYANEFDIEGLVSSPSFGEGSKEEILRMIDEYELDLPKLQRGLKASGIADAYPSPDELRAITKQGRKSLAPLKGYDTPTEGSEWIVECARRKGNSAEKDNRPLWVLVWGALEDVTQALHDAPDIADDIRVYWIGGPNKKWGSNAYNYIVENFPNLWFVENNASYRGVIGSANDQSLYQAAYWPTFMKGAGVMGDDFINYYKGIVKMGDTPSLLYLMSGDAENPQGEHWGGSFIPMSASPKYIIDGPLCATDTVPVYSLMEWRLKGPSEGVAIDSVGFILTIDRQNWEGRYEGDGIYTVRYSPKAPARLPYTISSTLPGFPEHKGEFVAGNEWPGEKKFDHSSPTITPVPVKLGKTWFTDRLDFTSADGKPSKWQGTASIAKWREEILRDWAERWKWLKDAK